jgi:hypothetical protein
VTGYLTLTLFECDVHILRCRFFGAENITGGSRIVRASCLDQRTKSACIQRRRSLLLEARQKGVQNRKGKGD